MGSRIIGKKQSGLKGHWVVLSEQPDVVADCANITQFDTEIPASEPANVLIDDASFSYQQIVDTIASHQRKNVFFHIFASHSQIVITPKMNG